MKNPLTKSNTGYRVSIAGDTGYFSPEGYSGYNNRFELHRKGQIDYVYGFDQAVDHVNELRENVYNGIQHYRHSQFIITIVTTTETQIFI